MPSWCPFVGTSYSVKFQPKTDSDSDDESRRDRRISFVSCKGHLLLKTTGTVLGKVSKVQNCSPYYATLREFRSYKDLKQAVRQKHGCKDFIPHFGFTDLPPYPEENCLSPTASVYATVKSKDDLEAFDPKKTSDLGNFMRGTFARAICLLTWNRDVW